MRKIIFLLGICFFLSACNAEPVQVDGLRLYAFVYNSEGVPEWAELADGAEYCIVYDSVVTEGGINRTVTAKGNGTVECEWLSGDCQLFFGKTKPVGKGTVMDYTAEILTGMKYQAEETCAVNVYPSGDGEIRIAFRTEGTERILIFYQQEREGLSEEQLRHSATIQVAANTAGK